jgi:hypothetical protein
VGGGLVRSIKSRRSFVKPKQASWQPDGDMPQQSQNVSVFSEDTIVFAANAAKM